MNLRAFVSSIGHPAYTGPARNPGFVVANVVVASLLAVAVDWVVPLSGSVVVGVALVLLAVRGYAVPGTPKAVRLIERRFDVSGTNGTSASTAADVRSLRRAGVLERRGDRLSMTDAFAAAWREQAASIGPRWQDERHLATALNVAPGQVELRWQEHGRLLVADVAGVPMGAWLSRAALVADIATISALRRYPEWHASSPQHRGAMLPTLRRALDRCPACDGRLSHGCAASRLHGDGCDTRAVTCLDCDARLFEGAFDAGGLRFAGDRSTSLVGP